MARGLKILHSIRTLDPETGGPVEVVRQFSHALALAGHRCTILALDSPEAPWRGQWEHPLVMLGPARGIYGGCLGLVPWLRRYQEHFDAVVAHGLWQYSSLGVWQALRGGGAPYFIYPHGMLDPALKSAYPLKHLKKTLYWLWAERRVLRDARAVLYTCEEERRLARSTFPLYRCHERLAPLGVPRPPGDPQQERELFLRQFPACRGKRLVLFLGRLHGKKGCDLLLRAFPQACPGPDWRLVMAGPGHPGEDFQALARQEGLNERVEWTGHLGGGLKWGAFHAAEVFALPSRQENFGMAVAESLACGLPVLLSSKVNIWREVAQDGAAFVQNPTVEGTAALLRQWAQTPAPERAAMRQRARLSFEQRFEITRAAQNLAGVLEEEIHRQTRPGRAM